jgi:hypothetical protein
MYLSFEKEWKLILKMLQYVVLEFYNVIEQINEIKAFSSVLKKA